MNQLSFDIDYSTPGNCMIVVENRVKELLDQGVEDFKVIEGWVWNDIDAYPTEHTWIERDGVKEDSTFIQFGEDYSYYEGVDEEGKEWKNREYTPQEYLELCKRFPEEKKLSWKRPATKIEPGGRTHKLLPLIDEKGVRGLYRQDNLKKEGWKIEPLELTYEELGEYVEKHGGEASVLSIEYFESRDEFYIEKTWYSGYDEHSLKVAKGRIFTLAMVKSFHQALATIEQFSLDHSIPILKGLKYYEARDIQLARDEKNRISSLKVGWKVTPIVTDLRKLIDETGQEVRVITIRLDEDTVRADGMNYKVMLMSYSSYSGNDWSVVTDWGREISRERSFHEAINIAEKYCIEHGLLLYKGHEYWEASYKQEDEDRRAKSTEGGIKKLLKKIPKYSWVVDKLKKVSWQVEKDYIRIEDVNTTEDAMTWLAQHEYSTGVSRDRVKDNSHIMNYILENMEIDSEFLSPEIIVLGKNINLIGFRDIAQEKFRERFLERYKKIRDERVVLGVDEEGGEITRIGNYGETAVRLMFITEAYEMIGEEVFEYPIYQDIGRQLIEIMDKYFLSLNYNTDYEKFKVARNLVQSFWSYSFFLHGDSERKVIECINHFTDLVPSGSRLDDRRKGEILDIIYNIRSGLYQLLEKVRYSNKKLSWKVVEFKVGDYVVLRQDIGKGEDTTRNITKFYLKSGYDLYAVISDLNHYGKARVTEVDENNVLITISGRMRSYRIPLEVAKELLEVSNSQKESNKFEGRLGKCYVLTYRYMLNEGGEGMRLVHGLITQKNTSKTIDHAWIEKDNMVIDCVLDWEIDKEAYYGIFDAVAEREYTLDEMLKRGLKFENYGPWHGKSKLSWQFTPSITKSIGWLVRYQMAESKVEYGVVVDVKEVEFEVLKGDSYRAVLAIWENSAEEAIDSYLCSKKYNVNIGRLWNWIYPSQIDRWEVLQKIEKSSETLGSRKFSDNLTCLPKDVESHRGSQANNEILTNSIRKLGWARVREFKVADVVRLKEDVSWERAVDIITDVPHLEKYWKSIKEYTWTIVDITPIYLNMMADDYIPESFCISVLRKNASEILEIVEDVDKDVISKLSWKIFKWVKVKSKDKLKVGDVVRLQEGIPPNKRRWRFYGASEDYETSKKIEEVPALTRGVVAEVEGIRDRSQVGIQWEGYPETSSGEGWWTYADSLEVEKSGLENRTWKIIEVGTRFRFKEEYLSKEGKVPWKLPEFRVGDKVRMRDVFWEEAATVIPTLSPEEWAEIQDIGGVWTVEDITSTYFFVRFRNSNLTRVVVRDGATKVLEVIEVIDKDALKISWKVVDISEGLNEEDVISMIKQGKEVDRMLSIDVDMPRGWTELKYRIVVIRNIKYDESSNKLKYDRSIDPRYVPRDHGPFKTFREACDKIRELSQQFNISIYLGKEFQFARESKIIPKYSWVVDKKGKLAWVPNAGNIEKVAWVTDQMRKEKLISIFEHFESHRITTTYAAEFNIKMSSINVPESIRSSMNEEALVTIGREYIETKLEEFIDNLEAQEWVNVVEVHGKSGGWLVVVPEEEDMIRSFLDRNIGIEEAYPNYMEDLQKIATELYKVKGQIEEGKWKIVKTLESVEFWRLQPRASSKVGWKVNVVEELEPKDFVKKINMGERINKMVSIMALGEWYYVITIDEEIQSPTTDKYDKFTVGVRGEYGQYRTFPEAIDVMRKAAENEHIYIFKGTDFKNAEARWEKQSKLSWKVTPEYKYTVSYEDANDLSDGYSSSNFEEIIDKLVEKINGGWLNNVSEIYRIEVGKSLQSYEVIYSGGEDVWYTSKLNEDELRYITENISILREFFSTI